MSILDDLNSQLPNDWHLTHIIYLDPEWQVNISNDEYAITATGATIEDALIAAHEKTFNPSNHLGRLFDLGHIEPSSYFIRGSLAERLGLIRKQEPIKRRI